MLIIFALLIACDAINTSGINITSNINVTTTNMTQGLPAQPTGLMAL